MYQGCWNSSQVSLREREREREREIEREQRASEMLEFKLGIV